MWSALLRWSLSQGGEPQPARPMSAEDRAFLEAVIKEHTVDVAKKLGELLQMVQDNNDAKNALEAIEDIVHDLDFARDLCKLGGMDVVVRALEGPPDVQVAACSVITAVTQNDATCQEYVDPAVLVRLFEAGQHAALSPLSACIRGNAKREVEFARGPGARVIKQGLQGPRKAKASFLLYALTYDGDNIPCFEGAWDEAFRNLEEEHAIKAILRAAIASPWFRDTYRSQLTRMSQDEEGLYAKVQQLL